MSSLFKMRTRSISLMVFPFVAMVMVALAGDGQKRLNVEKSQGQVRVILLRVGPVVSTNSQPGFVVTYAVEIPLKGAFSDLHFSSGNEITLADHGKPIDFPSEVSSGAMDFNDLPRQDELIRPVTPDERAMIAEDIVFTGLTIQAKKIDVRIQFSWRGSPMLFDFKSMPVN